MIKLLNLYGKDKYKDEKAIEDVIKYMAKEGDKSKAPYTYGVMCSGNYEQAAVDFQRTQELYNKEPSTKIRHFVIRPEAVYPEELLKKWMLQLGDMFNAASMGNEYQMFFAVHVDRKVPHIHFALNPVSYENGAGFYCDDEIMHNMGEIIAEMTNQEVQFMNKKADYPDVSKVCA